MSGNSESQCYLTQLQIDTFLDGELSTAQQDVFMRHVHGCGACAAELRYARVLQDQLLELPPLDCDNRVLNPVYENARSLGLLTSLRDWLAGLNPGLRYAMPAALVVVLALVLLPLLEEQPTPAPMVADNPTAAPADYSPQEVAAALRDLNLAIEYLNEVSERTEVMIGERFLITPLRESLNASFEEALDRDEPALNNGPI
ncbi:MAG: zf-HC2 domain-containing protein [Pseudohongiellaceae bacterium]